MDRTELHEHLFVNIKEIIIYFAQDGNFRSTIPNIKIDGRDIAQVCNGKLLGVAISQDLIWHKHVENIVKRPVNECTCYIS